MRPFPRVGDRHPLRVFFTVLTEKNFYEQLGWPDHRVIRYVADLLADFSDVDRVYSFLDQGGRARTMVSEMLLDAELGTSGVADRDAHRQIGDFTLFMMGLFPEHLTRLKTRILSGSGDFLLDYVKVGKRSYRIVAELPDDASEARMGEAPLFRRLSEHFELCVAGLGYIREDLRRQRRTPLDRFRERFLN
jgi:hypothetical protein